MNERGPAQDSTKARRHTFAGLYVQCSRKAQCSAKEGVFTTERLPTLLIQVKGEEGDYLESLKSGCRPVQLFGIGAQSICIYTKSICQMVTEHLLDAMRIGVNLSMMLQATATYSSSSPVGVTMKLTRAPSRGIAFMKTSKKHSRVPLWL